MSNDTQQEIATSENAQTRKVRSQTPLYKTTRWLTYAAMFTALAVLMKFIGQFLTITPSFKVTLIYAVWLIAGASLGVFGGAAVCFASDMLGAVIFPTGAINPFLVLGNTAYGAIAALAFRYFPVRNNYVRFAFSWLVCTLVCTCIANSLALYYSYGYHKVMSFWVYFAAYRAFQPVVALINIALTLSMVPLLSLMRLLPGTKASAPPVGDEPASLDNQGDAEVMQTENADVTQKESADVTQINDPVEEDDHA